MKSLCLSALLIVAATLPAAALDAPKGPVVLTVKGAITVTNGPDGASFDMAMLDALVQHTIVTETPWTKGTVTFAGPLGSALLEAVGATGATLTITALNDYSADVPASDFAGYQAILATTLDGKAMSVRDKGPLFLVYPFDSNPELYNEVYFGRSVWQISSITVK